MVSSQNRCPRSRFGDRGPDNGCSQRGLKVEFPAYDFFADNRTQFCQQAQQTMSSTASNYSLRHLLLGIGIALIAFLISLSSSGGYLLEAGPTGVWTVLVGTIYGMMMFASSFVEEEHHFWYWTASGWFAWQIIKRCRLSCPMYFISVDLTNGT